MAKGDPFLEFLRDRQRQETNEDWNAIKKAWLGTLATLMSKLKDWLQDAVDADLIRIEESKEPRTEDYLGTYDVPVLTIRGPLSRSVRIVPQHRLTFGSTGRVDLESGPLRAKLIQVKRGWKFVREDFSEGPLAKLSLPTKRELTDLSRETFLDRIRELLA